MLLTAYLNVVSTLYGLRPFVSRVFFFFVVSRPSVEASPPLPTLKEVFCSSGRD